MAPVLIWLIGFLLACASPTSVFPCALGATFAALLITFAVYAVHRLRKSADLEDCLLLGAATLLALAPTINTNELVLNLAIVGWAATTLLYVLRASTIYPAPENVFSYIRGVVDLSLALLGTLLSSQTYTSLFPKTLTVKFKKLDTTILTSLWIMFIVLFIFHLLFSAVNSEYAQFVRDFFQELWWLIRNIVDLFNVCKAIGFAAVSAGAYQILLQSQAKVTQATKLGVKTLVVIAPLVVIFAVFSMFQGKLLFLDPTKLEFKALSLYTQKGFWELLVASFIGYAVWFQAVRTRSPEAPAAGRLNFLLYIFLTELILIALFTTHKLVLLQYYFGLKDTRVVASLAVALISATFILGFFRLKQKLSDRSIFVLQYRAMVVVLLLLLFGNLDGLITSTYPTRYIVNGNWQMDYSYLLGNSLDNHSQWMSIIAEAERTGIAFPQDYYWGNYASLCDNSRNSTQEGLRRLIVPTNQSYDIREFNLRAYQARHTAALHAEEIASFLQLVSDECVRLGMRLRTPNKAKAASY